MPKAEDPFYVGYLPTPRPHERFAQLALVALLALAATGGAGLGWLMDDPGEAVWDTSSTTAVAGTLRLTPTAFVESDDGPVLLVEAGKFGARDLSSIVDGTVVTVTGFRLERGPMRMIELSPDEDAVVAGGAGGAAGNPTTDRTSRGEVEIVGEIVDSKCFLGAMKPGDGRTHAACARLCIRGGIPASIVGTIDGEPIWAVLDAGAAEHIGDELLQAVGEEVRLRGTLATVHGLPVLSDAVLIGITD